MQYIPQRILKLSYRYIRLWIKNNKVQDIYVASLYTTYQRYLMAIYWPKKYQISFVSFRIWTILSNSNGFCLIAQIRWWSLYVVYTWKKVFKSYHNNIPLRWKTSKSCYAELLWAGKLSLVVVIGGCTRTSLIQQQGFLDIMKMKLICELPSLQGLKSVYIYKIFRGSPRHISCSILVV